MTDVTAAISKAKDDLLEMITTDATFTNCVAEVSKDAICFPKTLITHVSSCDANDAKDDTEHRDTEDVITTVCHVTTLNKDTYNDTHFLPEAVLKDVIVGEKNGTDTAILLGSDYEMEDVERLNDMDEIVTPPSSKKQESSGRSKGLTATETPPEVADNADKGCDSDAPPSKRPRPVLVLPPKEGMFTRGRTRKLSVKPVVIKPKPVPAVTVVIKPKPEPAMTVVVKPKPEAAATPKPDPVSAPKSTPEPTTQRKPDLAMTPTPMPTESVVTPSDSYIMQYTASILQTSPLPKPEDSVPQAFYGTESVIGTAAMATAAPMLTAAPSIQATAARMWTDGRPSVRPAKVISIVPFAEVLTPEDMALEQLGPYELLTMFRGDVRTQMEWLARRGLLYNSFRCVRCHHQCSLIQNRGSGDGYQWKCTPCRSKRSIRKHSFFSTGHIGFAKVAWILFYWSIEAPVGTVMWTLGISTATAIDWLNFIREVCSEDMKSKPVKLGGEDEMGKPVIVEVGRSKCLRKAGNWVFGAVERHSGRCMLEVVPEDGSVTLQAFIQRTIIPGSHIMSGHWVTAMTDISQINGGIYMHDRVKYGSDSIDKVVHTQTVDGMWARATRKIRRQYGTSNALFETYLQEFMWLERHKKHELRLSALLVCIREQYTNRKM